MENVFVLTTHAQLIGVYTSHRKAVQAMIKETLPFGYTMSDYTYDFGVEYFTFIDKDYKEKTYELQEVMPDGRV